jgi:hypothetical protein
MVYKVGSDNSVAIPERKLVTMRGSDGCSYEEAPRQPRGQGTPVFHRIVSDSASCTVVSLLRCSAKYVLVHLRTCLVKLRLNHDAIALLVST